MDVGFKDLATIVGQEIGVSDWLLVDQERVNRFAEATDDRQWIHVDIERATQAMGGTIAHGYLVLSLIPVLSEGMLNVSGLAFALNYGSNRVRFINMVRVGKRIRMRQKVLEVRPQGPGQLMAIESTIEIEGEAKPACVAETLVLMVGS